MSPESEGGSICRQRRMTDHKPLHTFLFELPQKMKKGNTDDFPNSLSCDRWRRSGNCMMRLFYLFIPLKGKAKALGNLMKVAFASFPPKGLFSLQPLVGKGKIEGEGLTI